MQQVGSQAATRKAAPGALRRLLRRFGRDRDGATAVEFAMISVPFFGLLCDFPNRLRIPGAGGSRRRDCCGARQLLTGQAQSISPSRPQSIREFADLQPDAAGATNPTDFYQLRQSHRRLSQAPASPAPTYRRAFIRIRRPI